MIKKVISLIVALAMVVSICGCTASTVSIKESDTVSAASNAAYASDGTVTDKGDSAVKGEIVTGYKDGWSFDSLYDTAEKQRTLIEVDMNKGFKQALLDECVSSSDECKAAYEKCKEKYGEVVDTYLIANSLCCYELVYEIEAEYGEELQDMASDVISLTKPLTLYQSVGLDGAADDASTNIVFDAIGAMFKNGETVYTEASTEDYTEDYVAETPEPVVFNTSEYNVIEENGFKDSKLSPLSTFSIDTNTASYTMFKLATLTGSMLSKDAIKIEEMLNYFNFKYKDSDRVEGAENKPFSINTVYTSCPWNDEHKLLRVGITANEVTEEPGTNFVFVVDVSGSMLSVDKLPLVCMAYSDLVDELSDKDKVSITHYASGTGVDIEGISCGSEENRETIYRTLAKLLLNAGGGTAGFEGLNTAYDICKKNFVENGVNRVIIATDGDFNIGRSSSSDLKELVENECKNGVYLTILGFGSENLKDNKMETMAKYGDGNYYYIADLTDARKSLISERGCTLIPVADNVKIQVEFNPNTVSQYRLLGYEKNLLNAEDFNNDKVDAGDVGAGKSVTALYEIVTANGEADSSSEMKFSNNVVADNTEDICNVAVRYKDINSKVTGDASERIDLLVKASDYAEAPDNNTAFIASVAELGMLLRDSEFKGSSSLQHMYDIAKASVTEESTEWQKKHIEILDKLLETNKN